MSAGVFVAHGVVACKQRSLFVHRNLEDEALYAASLRRARPFVCLRRALRGDGHALTIDDGTQAAGRAALIARDLGHAVTLFVNPWNVLNETAYYFSVLNALLDATTTTSIRVGSLEYAATTFAERHALRRLIKEQLCSERTEDGRARVLNEWRERLAVSDVTVPPYLHPLTLRAISGSYLRGVSRLKITGGLTAIYRLRRRRTWFRRWNRGVHGFGMHLALIASSSPHRSVKPFRQPLSPSTLSRSG
jgi:hypothetical protein